MDADAPGQPEDEPKRRRRSAPPPEPVAPDPAAPSTLLSQPRPALAGLDRRTIALAAATLVVIWLVLVFGRAVSQANQVANQAASMRMENAAMAAQLREKQSELSVIQSPQFVALEARGYGYGTPNEQVFALQPGSSAPPSITPLGEQPVAPPSPTPLDAWLRLLLDGR